MSRRFLICMVLSLCAFAMATPALAGSHVIAQKSSKKVMGAVFLSANLKTGHTYRVDITASGHHPFNGYGTQTVVGVSKGRLFTGNPPSLSLNGTTPRSFMVKQPTSGKLSEWILAIDVQLKAGRGLTVRVIDLGSH